MAMVELRRVTDLDDEVAGLAAEAEHAGWRFMRRLWDEWQSGANRFDAEGEFLLAAHVDGRLAAVGGLNRDPYGAPGDVGRLRHLYVAIGFRRRGVGRTLVERIVADATPKFTSVRLRTTTAEGAAFYEQLGSRRTDDDNATHLIGLPASLAQSRAAR